MHSLDDLTNRLAEAARYALLRRVVPAIRHNIAGALQPIGMMAAMLEKRVQKPDPDLAVLAQKSSAINILAREAVTECMDVMTWLAPEDDGSVFLNAGVANALSLVATDLSFRGFTLVNETGQVSSGLPRAVIRGVFMAGLLALTDAVLESSRVRVTAEVSGDDILLVISIIPDVPATPVTSLVNTFRQIAWADVQALAEAESVAYSHSPCRFELRCPAIPMKA